jgi:hypothetical protein
MSDPAQHARQIAVATEIHAQVVALLRRITPAARAEFVAIALGFLEGELLEKNSRGAPSEYKAQVSLGRRGTWRSRSDRRYGATGRLIEMAVYAIAHDLVDVPPLLRLAVARQAISGLAQQERAAGRLPATPLPPPPARPRERTPRRSSRPRPRRGGR